MLAVNGPSQLKQHNVLYWNTLAALPSGSAFLLFPPDSPSPYPAFPFWLAWEFLFLGSRTMAFSWGLPLDRSGIQYPTGIPPKWVHSCRLLSIRVWHPSFRGEEGVVLSALQGGALLLAGSLVRRTLGLGSWGPVFRVAAYDCRYLEMWGITLVFSGKCCSIFHKSILLMAAKVKWSQCFINQLKICSVFVFPSP